MVLGKLRTGTNKGETMTPEEFHDRMIALETGDEESDHARADDLMCQALTELGYQDGVKVFETMGKWYA